MTIKERKQITGTTAQIQAYAGHEGQIVWDKEKKTFVGMSGTAGTNYPLAPKAYVDTQLTEGIEGKEDKGVCLPLTGGEMLNPITFKGKALVGYDFSNPQFEELVLASHTSQGNNLGGVVSLRGHNGSNEAQRGSFMLGARSADGSIGNYLVGDVAGNLTWTGYSISQITGMGDGWIRFGPNLQICFGVSKTTPDGFVTIGYRLPFSKNPSVTATLIGGYNSGGSPFVCYVSANTNFFNTYVFRNGALTPGVQFTWIAIGYY